MKNKLFLLGLFIGVLVTSASIYRYFQFHDMISGYESYSFSDFGNSNDKYNYIPYSDNIVTARGTWLKENDTPTQIHVSSKIECYKKEMLCYEADAKNYNGSLISDLVLYQIKEWTQSKIIAIDDYGLCANNQLTFDRNLRTVVQTNFVVKNDGICKDWNKDSLYPVIIHLGDGMKVFFH